jgi:hypothetical protein
MPQGVKDVEPILSDRLGIGLACGLVPGQACVLDPLVIARILFQGHQPLQPVGHHGGQLDERRSEGLGDSFQPSEDMDGGQDMGGVRPLLPACLEEPEGPAALEPCVQQQGFRAAGEQAVPELTEHRKIEPWIVSLQAE